MVSSKKDLKINLANKPPVSLDTHMANLYANAAEETSKSFRDRSRELDHKPSRQERRKTERQTTKQHKAIERMFRIYERARLAKDFEGPANQLERAFENAIVEREARERARNGQED